jgi:hypothetical protein
MKNEAKVTRRPDGHAAADPYEPLDEDSIGNYYEESVELAGAGDDWDDGNESFVPIGQQP